MRAKRAKLGCALVIGASELPHSNVYSTFDLLYPSRPSALYIECKDTIFSKQTKLFGLFFEEK